MCRAAYYSLLNFVDASTYFQNNDHGMEVCRKFLELVNEECMKHRDLYYYAMRLSMSPKTLYSLVKSKTGTSPSRMIAGCTIQKAKHILSTTDKTVGQISDMFGFCSQSDFGKYFKRETGLSVTEYVQRERIATAKNMLKYSDYTAQQIATALGFSSQSYFTKVFRQTTGHTPTDYRRRYHHSTGFGE